eukprot:TRINITY_DN72660_c0_g1_i1.p1 TRINITY_DN72660_c0_g1~~TRINITY_DN72660_c0_g1_i1.p1  ORF type:complete len:548 (+),score=72.59 TRINITY_DN72660_c0_g1_i1:94-1737(+)
MPGRTAARLPVASERQRRVLRRGAAKDSVVDGDSARTTGLLDWRRWALLPQDLGVLVCQCLGPRDLVDFILTAKKQHALGLREEVWRFFCRQRWGESANFHAYQRAEALYFDRNGWFPQRCGQRRRPRFETRTLKLHSEPCMTMDLRITDQEIVAVSEAPRNGTSIGEASVQVVDPQDGCVRERFKVSKATINCCDTRQGLICLGSDDAKVRIYRRSPGGGSLCNSAGDAYSLAVEFACRSEVNDLRYTREDAVIAVRTQEDRHPDGLDVIWLDRPDARLSLVGGGPEMRGKYIHAIDGFEDGCSLGNVACSGENPVTSAFSAMLLDFRRPSPCVVDVTVASVQQGHPVGTMLWPLRAGRGSKVFANLLHERDGKRSHGTIAMVDFRYPTGYEATYEFEHPVDDFRYFDGHIYAACTDNVVNQQRLRILRCDPHRPDVAESLCTVAEAFDEPGRGAKEDLKVFSICQRGFVTSFGESLSLCTVADPWSALDEGTGCLDMEEVVLTHSTPRRRRAGVLVEEPLEAEEGEFTDGTTYSYSQDSSGSLSA